MAVEARHLNLFPPQLLGSRLMNNPIEANANLYGTQMGYGVPLSGTPTTTETLLPMYSSVITDSIPQKAAIKSDNNSSLTYNNNSNNLPLSRKRTRDSLNPLFSYNPSLQKTSCANTATPISFLGHDMSLQIQQQQLDIDCLISQHMEKVRMEIEERRKRQAKKTMEAIEEGVMKKLRAKEEEIEKIGKLNWALEERVKSLCIENQIWRDLAQTNEATANVLRTNLEQVLAAQVKEDHHQQQQTQNDAGLDQLLMDDAQSCCGSNYEEEKKGKNNEQEEGTSRLCRNCRKEESCVLLLPCRHLCLCTVCGSTVHTCPICKSSKNASVHVNMS